MRELPANSGAGLAIKVRLESEPKIQFEHASLVWCGDDDNYAGLFVEALGGKTKLQMVVRRRGSRSSRSPTGTRNLCGCGS